MIPATPDKLPRCPYCVLDGQFRPMQILENGRQICENCGHIVFPNDEAFLVSLSGLYQNDVLAQNSRHALVAFMAPRLCHN
jgi:hypothetical protein